MDADNLLEIDYLASAGIVLSTEVRTALETSLVILKQTERFKRVVFWGKISGVNRDYYIAQGIGSNEVTSRKTFYSTDAIEWAQVANVHPIIISSSLKIRGRFTGNPSHEYVVNEIVQDGIDSASLPDEVHAIRTEVPRDDGAKVVTTTITEDKRLAAAVATLDHDAAIIPRGALLKRTTGAVESSRTFEGLSDVDAGKLENYVHLRTAEHLPQKPLLERAKLDPAIDFLDSIADDSPRGVWSLARERGGSVILLRSLLWPGFVFYHLPGTRKFGHVYFGVFSKNLDLPFMLA